jgi:phosphatidylserine/phosphatidylglycerophosphate/cardiolipin synthase-like enzyme
MSIVDGDAAAALGELFRARWLRCTGEMVPTPGPITPEAWPPDVTPGFTDVAVGVSRTEAAWRRYPEVRECETLHLASIAAARRCIYMENQYFTSEVMAAALAARLAEPDGPEVLLISSEHSPSYFDQMTMDRTRLAFIKTLQAADRHGRLQAYSPVTALGLTIIVHAKLTIIDDRLLRVASANINNRSMGFDTECDLSLEAGTAQASQTISHLRTRLLAHWLGCADEVVDAATQGEQGVTRGVEALRSAGYCRLRPILPTPLSPPAAAVARLHLGDPISSRDSWRPWRRRAAIGQRLAAARLPRAIPSAE